MLLIFWSKTNENIRFHRRKNEISFWDFLSFAIPRFRLSPFGRKSHSLRSMLTLIDFDIIDCNPGEVNLIIVHNSTSWSKTPRVSFIIGEFQISGKSFDESAIVIFRFRETVDGTTFVELDIKARGCGQEGYHQIPMSTGDYRFVVNKLRRLQNEVESGEMDH